MAELARLKRLSRPAEISFAKQFVIAEPSAQLFDNLVGRNEVIRQFLSKTGSTAVLI